MAIRTIPIDTINPAPYNPRVDLQPGNAEYDKLAQSIERFGLVDPLVWNERTGNLVGGHQRLKILVERGDTDIEVSTVDLDANEEKALNLALNKISGDWDFSKLADLLLDLDAQNFDLDFTGFGADEIEQMMHWTPDGGEEVEEDDFDPEAALEAMGEPTCKCEEMWQLGKHRLMCGDSTSKDDVISLMGGYEGMVTALTDPPYGIDIVKGSTGKVGGAAPTHFGRTDSPNIVDSRTYAAVEGDDTTDTARAAYGCLCDVGCANFIIWGGNYFTDFLPPSRCWIVWDKENTGNFADAELAWTSFSKGVKLYRWMWNGLARKGARSVEGKTRVHPTQKPVGLHGEIMRDYTEAGAVIVDPFLGSGTTLIAAEQTGRVCYGMEISERYCDVIIQRWEKLTGKKAERV